MSELKALELRNAAGSVQSLKLNRIKGRSFYLVRLQLRGRERGWKKECT